MKLLMVTNYFHSHMGGIELVAEKLFRGLTQRQCKVVWAAANVTVPPSEVAFGSVLPLKSWNAVEGITGLPFPVPSLGALRKLCSQVRRADVVLLHDCLYISNIIAFLQARVSGVRVIVVQHTRIAPYHDFIKRTLLRVANALVTRAMLASADQVIFISQNIARDFQSFSFSQPPAVVFNGVDATVFTPLAEGEDKPALRETLGLRQQGPVALFVGRFIQNKGISIMRRMAELRPDWTWAFAGWGPLDPAGWNAPNVRVFSNLRGGSLAVLYRACDLLVLPSLAEGFGLVVAEALACGLPVVCSADMLGADDAMRDFVRGVPVSVGNDDRTAREFLKAIDELTASETEKGRSAQRRAFAVSRYSWDAAADRYLEIASSLVTTGGADAVEDESLAGEGRR